MNKACTLAIAAFWALSACSSEPTVNEEVAVEASQETTVTEDEHSHHEHQHEVAEDEMIVENAIIRPPLGGKTITGGYFTLVSGSDDKLIAAETDIAEKVELHTHENVDGMMQMRQIEFADVKAGEPLIFKPKEKHLMLFGIQPVEESQDVDMTLIFESGKKLSVPFTVMQPKLSDEGGHKH